MQTHSLRNASQKKNLHNAICEVNPVPNNLNQVKKMDEFLKNVLKERHENKSLAIDKIL